MTTMSNLDKLKQLKRSYTYAKLSQLLNISENNLVRWITETVKISPAYEELLNQKLTKIGY
jgi:succinate dehydrogenase flavin-adding protein (antitoxin of CptAB toxin-antitoxin module)